MTTGFFIGEARNTLRSTDQYGEIFPALKVLAASFVIVLVLLLVFDLQRADSITSTSRSTRNRLRLPG
jgi:hypothetical protein